MNIFAHDTVNIWLGRPPQLPEPFAALMSNWHVEHVFRNIIPVLTKEGVTEEQLEQMFVKNPATLFA
jgi:phosphotriesterase-related protein